MEEGSLEGCEGGHEFSMLDMGIDYRTPDEPSKLILLFHFRYVDYETVWSGAHEQHKSPKNKDLPCGPLVHGASSSTLPPSSSINGKMSIIASWCGWSSFLGIFSLWKL